MLGFPGLGLRVSGFRAQGVGMTECLLYSHTPMGYWTLRVP